MPKTPLFVFDLDDTLYDEFTFVQGGFRAVAYFLSPLLQIDQKILENEMLNILARDGRGQVFDALLKQHGVRKPGVAKECLKIYRTHVPNLTLYPDAQRCLNRYQKHPLYLVTDGHKNVQSSKIQALGLERVMRHCFVTRNYGLKHEKPSPYCFLKICQKEHVTPQTVVYIGDDPSKDFVGIKPLGFQTVRVLRGRHKHIKMPPEYEADRTILTLDEL